jgi:hypothetical protein
VHWLATMYVDCEISAVFETNVMVILRLQRVTLATADLKPHLIRLLFPGFKHFPKVCACSVCH